MHLFVVVPIVIASFAEIYAADPGQERPSSGKKQAVLVPLGTQEFPSDFQYNFNFLEPQYQYSSVGGFNYVPNKQPSFPRSQPPIILLAGAVPPGQQFLLHQPGVPPGNFLFPQPEGPNFILRGNPNQQNPVFESGYPKPAYVPPIEKDAEEVPNLAGNHPATRGPSYLVRRPEKLETLDEPQPQGPNEEDPAYSFGKNPSPYPKKFPAPPQTPSLKPGQSFFILNGRPLYSNFPIDPHRYQPSATPQSDVFYLRAAQPQPQFITPPQQPTYRQFPAQDLFIRNSIAGEISDVRTLPAAAFEKGNLVSLNQPEDFRQQAILLRAALPEGLELEAGKKPGQARLGKNVRIVAQPAFLPGAFLPTFGTSLYFADAKNIKDEDDTIVIDAKVQDEVESDAVKTSAKAEEEEGSLSQSQPAAIAIAGIGGVASAGPRGTALAGPKGLAVSNPQATAVAGPKADEEDEKDKKPPKSKKEKH